MALDADISQIERAASPILAEAPMEAPVHAERSRFPRRMADEAKVTDLTVAFGAEFTHRVDLASDYPFAEEMRQAVWDSLSKVNGELVDSEHEQAALALNLLFSRAQELRTKLAEGHSPEVVFVTEIFSRWKEIRDFPSDAEAFELSLELNKALRKRPEIYYETRLGLRESQKDLNNELEAPLEKNVMQSVHIEGVADLCSEPRYEMTPTIGDGGISKCVDAGEMPLLAIVAELHDFAKLNGAASYVWEHEALSAIASVQIADEVLLALSTRLKLPWLEDETKRRKVAMLIAKAILGHGDQEYPHNQVLKGGENVETVERDGVRIAKIEAFGVTNFFIEPPNRQAMLDEIPDEIRSDPEKNRFAVRFVTGVRDEDRKDGCGGKAEMKYFLQYSPLQLFEGKEIESWGDCVDKLLLASFGDNLKTAGDFDAQEMTDQEKRLVYPTMLFASLVRQVGVDFESNDLKSQGQNRNSYIYGLDKVAPYIGEGAIFARASGDEKLAPPGFVDGRRNYSFFQRAVERLCEAEGIWRENRDRASELRKADDEKQKDLRQQSEQSGMPKDEQEKFLRGQVKQAAAERQRALVEGKTKLFTAMRNAMLDLMGVDFDHPANRAAAQMADTELQSRLA